MVEVEVEESTFRCCSRPVSSYACELGMGGVARTLDISAKTLLPAARREKKNPGPCSSACSTAVDYPLASLVFFS